jgi:soluble lytic murein transglycosylase-like protein/tetratricopeptide (TPR) repeat protein
MITAATLAAVVLAAPAARDPRPEIVALSRAGEPARALAIVERELTDGAERGRALGFDLLRGDLLERIDRPRDAVESYARALARNAGLAPWARYRLALAQERLGHPEVAAGLVATLLAQEPPETLVEPALDLLDRTLAGGGDCRLLRGIPRERFSGARRRQRELMDLRCLARPASRPGLVDAVRDYLAAESGDAFAWEALMLLDDAATFDQHRPTALLFGLTAYRHRDFERALGLLAPWVERGLEGPFDTLGRDAAYASARSEFWRGEYAAAGRRFAEIAAEARTAAQRSDAFHQLGRAQELAGDLDAAFASFDRAYHESPTGEWAAASLLSALRLEFLRGDEPAARRRLTVLAANSQFGAITARGAIFLASSGLVRGRTVGVAPLLALAARTREHSAVEVAYWRGRMYELQGDAERAIDEYLRAARERPFHPLVDAARRRLAARPLATAAAVRARALRASSDPGELWRASFLTTGDDLRRALARRGVERLAAHPTTAPWVASRILPVGDWPLWRSPSSRPEELLIALGLAELAPEAVPRAFPAQPADVGLTGAALLVGGPRARVGLAIAESIFARRPRALPLDWVARDFLAILYPRPWAELLTSQAVANGIDPHLLTAIVREESRFDPDAISPAAAQGLTQLVLPTARRLARRAGLPEVGLSDLRLPALSVTLGATHLAELDQRFQGEAAAIAAAYNAGEEQTALWMRSCLSSEPEELLAKIGFGETRAYVTRVLETRNAYRWLATAP